MISKDDIKKLANLARIELTPKEEEKFTHEIDSILGYVAQIQKASGKKNVEIVGKNKNTLREDNNPHESGIYTEAILNEAPKRQGEYIKVKKILGGGDNA